MTRRKRNRRNPPSKIDPNKLKGRDPNQMAIILGATKAGVQKDQKKEADKYKAREKVEETDDL